MRRRRSFRRGRARRVFSRGKRRGRRSGTRALRVGYRM